MNLFVKLQSREEANQDGQRRRIYWRLSCMYSIELFGQEFKVRNKGRWGKKLLKERKYYSEYNL